MLVLQQEMKGIRLVETCVKTTAAEPSAPVRPITSGVLIIESMPARLRPRVEELMVTCLPSASTWEIPGDDPLTAQWCTRWYKDWPGQDLAALAAGTGSDFDAVPPGIGCRQVLTGTHAELHALETAVRDLAQRYCFSARLSM